VIGVSGAGCGRKQAAPNQPQRLAILRFENLGPAAADNWMGRAFAEVISSELSSDPAISVIASTRLHNIENTFGVRPVNVPGISAERPAALAAGASRLVYGDYATVRGRLEARLWIEDPNTGRVPQTFSASAAAGDIVSAATTLARHLSARITEYPTRNGQALEAFTTAMEARTSPEATAALERAIAADPNFGPPYVLLAQLKAPQDRAGALAVLDSALARSGIPPAERARMEVEKATLQNNAAARDSALAALTAASPRDPAAWRAAAENAFAHRDYRKAVEAYRKLLELEPENAVAWNQLGYSAAGVRDLDTATKALRRYGEIKPNDPNAIDSLGDVHLMLGRLHEAEGFYLEAARKNPAFLNSGDYFKAAMARLMSGDVTGADSLAKEYIDARTAAHDPASPILAAEWAWTAGRRNAARGQLEAVARDNENSARAVSARAYAELAVWSVLLGDSRAADGHAQKALQLGGANQVSVIARFVSLPPAAAAEWTARATKMFPNAPANSLRDLVLAYALLANRQYDAAAPLLKQLYESPALVSEPGLPVDLAWALIETGRAQEAAPLLDLNPVPPPTGPGAVMGFYFPRLYQLRAAVAEKAGRNDEARANLELYRKLSGGGAQ
jgi:tetratricopeptide (TPR) repeat protein